ncbi:hypothetical protein ACMYYO_13150 [Dermacoccaceae bacterium W4C1]
MTELRADLLEWMREAPADKRAALVAQFRATLAEIDELAPPEQKGDAVDEIAARRAARRGDATTGSGKSKRSG